MTKNININHTAIIEIEEAMFHRYITRDINSFIKDIDILKNKVGAFQPDSNSAKVVITNFGGGDFTFNLRAYNDGTYTLVIYDVRGAEQIISVSFPFSGAEEAYQNAKSAAQDWLNGIMACSSCGCQIDRETTNRFLAGAYCDSCWERSYKEKKELYGC